MQSVAVCCTPSATLRLSCQAEPRARLQGQCAYMYSEKIPLSKNRTAEILLSSPCASSQPSSGQDPRSAVGVLCRNSSSHSSSLHRFRVPAPLVSAQPRQCLQSSTPASAVNSNHRRCVLVEGGRVDILDSCVLGDRWLAVCATCFRIPHLHEDRARTLLTRQTVWWDADAYQSTDLSETANRSTGICG